MLKSKEKEAHRRHTSFHPLKGRKEPAMKKNSKTEQESLDQKKNISLATADPDTIIAAAEEYVENGYSYPLFAPGCGCD